MPYVSPAGYRFLAGEMSIAAPIGLSGGPLFRPSVHQMVFGLAAGSLATYSDVDRIVEVKDGGKEYREVS
jgi:hypothetical protein